MSECNVYQCRIYAAIGEFSASSGNNFTNSNCRRSKVLRVWRNSAWEHIEGFPGSSLVVVPPPLCGIIVLKHQHVKGRGSLVFKIGYEQKASRAVASAITDAFLCCKASFLKDQRLFPSQSLASLLQAGRAWQQPCEAVGTVQEYISSSWYHGL